MRYKRPDQKNAESLVHAAKEEMAFTLSLERNGQSGATIVRNIYECFRMLGDALLIAQGVESEDHVAPIKELMNIKADTKRPINLIDSLRRLRHNINYYGYRPNMAEVHDAISIAESCFDPLFMAVKKKITEENGKKI